MSNNNQQKQTRKEGGFVRNTSSLLMGNMVAQIITVGLTPVITHLFSPDAFGEFSIVMAFVGPFVAIAALRYQEAIMLPESEDEVHALFRLASSLVLMTSLLLLIVIMIFKEEISGFVNLSTDSAVLYVVPLLVMLASVRRVFEAMLQRQKAFKQLAGAVISMAGTDRTVSITAGLTGSATSWGLLTGKIVGLSCGLIWIFVSIPGLITRAALGTGASVRVVAKRYSSFAIYSWSGLTQQLDRELPVIMLGTVFGVTTAGLFALARRVLIEPGLILGDALAKTFYQKASLAYRQGDNIDEITVELLRYLFRWIIPPMVLLVSVGPPLFEIVFGSEWRLAGSYALVLMPWFVAGFIMQPLSRLFNVLEKQKQWALYTLLNLSGTVIILTAGYYTESVEYTLIMLSTLGVVLSMSRGKWILVEIGVEKYKVLPLLLQAFLVAALLLIPVICVKYIYSQYEWLQVVIAIIIGASYIGYLVYSDPRFNSILTKKQ